jgi:hypothetical protein
MASRPSSPPRSDSPAGAMIGYFSSPFEKFMKEEQYQDWHSAFTLLGKSRSSVARFNC